MNDVVFLDDQVHGQLVDRAEEVLALRQTWDSIRGEALSHQQSIELMVEVAETWI